LEALYLGGEEHNNFITFRLPSPTGRVVASDKKRKRIILTREEGRGGTLISNQKKGQLIGRRRRREGYLPRKALKGEREHSPRQGKGKEKILCSQEKKSSQP